MRKNVYSKLARDGLHSGDVYKRQLQAEVKQVEDFSRVPADQIDEKLRAEMAGA